MAYTPGPKEMQPARLQGAPRRRSGTKGQEGKREIQSMKRESAKGRPKLKIDVKEEEWLVADKHLNILRKAISLKVEGKSVVYGFDEDTIRRVAGEIAKAAILSFCNGMYADVMDKGIKLHSVQSDTCYRIPNNSVYLQLTRERRDRLVAHLEKIRFKENGTLADGAMITLSRITLDPSIEYEP